MRKLTPLFFLVALLWAGAAQAENAWKTCAVSPLASNHIIDALGCKQYVFDENVSTTVDVEISCDATLCRLHFDPNIVTAGADDAELMVAACTVDIEDGNCTDIIDANLTGLAGQDGTQRTAVHFGRGKYRMEFKAQPGAGETGRVMIQGY